VVRGTQICNDDKNNYNNNSNNNYNSDNDNNNNNNNTVECTHGTQTEPAVQHSETYYYDTHRQYSDISDYNTTNTEDIISEYNNDMGNHLNNMNQNTTSTYTQHNHIMMYKSMHYNAICNNDDHINHHSNNTNTNNSNRSSSRAGNNGLQASPRVQHSESNYYDTHR
jgi:hypothetical protein